MEEHHHHNEGEIVFRITPRNLERIIYILIILGLLIFSIVEFRKNRQDCPIVECEDNEETVVEEITTAATTKTTTATETKKLSGEVEFLLTDVDLCVIDEDLDQGRFDDVKIYIKNGLSKTLKAEIQFYLWNDNEAFDEIEDKSIKIKDISILSGNVLSREFNEFSSPGIFKDIHKDKKIRAVVIDTESDKERGEVQFLSDIEVDSLC